MRGKVGPCAALVPSFAALIRRKSSGSSLQRLGDFIHHALDRIGADRRARRAIGRNLGAVGADVKTLRQQVRNVVGREAATGRAADRRARESAGLQIEGAVRGDDLAVLRGADLDRALRARCWPGRTHHFLARHHHLDGTAGFLRQHGRERLEIDDGLAAKTAADLGGDGADVALLNAGQHRGHGTDHELALARAPDRGLAVGRNRDEAGMRLDIALVHRARGEGALDDDVGLLEAFGDVALLVFEAAGDIRRFSFELVELVQDRRIRLDRVLDLDRPRQDLVVDLDQLAGFVCDRLRRRGNRCDRVPGKQRLVARHHVAAHPAHVLDAEHHRALLDREVDDVTRGDDRLDAGQALPPSPC